MFDKIKTYFLDEDGRSYYVDDKGNVNKSATQKPLELSPEGRKSISIGYERSMIDKELGAVRTYTLPTDYVRKAGKILKYIVYSQNIGVKLYLLIQKLKVTVDLLAATFRMQYQFVYKGQVDLTSFTDKDTRTSITVSEGGIAKQIKSKDTTNYEFNLDTDPEAVLVKNDGTYLYDTANFTVTNIDQKTVFGAGTGRYLPASMISRDGSAAGFAGFTNTGTTTYNEPPPIDQALFATSQVITGIRLTGKIKVQINFPYTPTAPFQASEKYVLCLNSNLRPGSVFNTPGIAYLNPNGKNGEPLHAKENLVTFDFDVTFDTLKDEYFTIYAYGPGFQPSVISKFEYIETDFKISFRSRWKTTYEKGLKLSTLGKRLTGKTTGDESNIDLSFLQQHDNLILTSQDGLRGLAGAKVKTNLKDYKDFVWVQLAASRTVENNKLIFREFPYFLKTTTSTSLGGVAKFVSTVAKDLLCNKIHAGYPVQQIDDVNGKYSFHNTLYFSSPLDLDEPKALELISPYIACPFYQEIKRINLDGQTTTDDQGDNTVVVKDCRPISEILSGNTVIIGSDSNGNFFTVSGLNDKIDLFKIRFSISGTLSNDGTYITKADSGTFKGIIDNGTSLTVYVNENIVPETIASAQFTIEYYELYRPSYSSFAGVPEIETLYNVELSSKQILLKHYKWINSIFYGFQGQKITYESTEKNSDFERTLNGVVIKEKSSYTITTDILFKPFYFEFNTIVPVTTIEDLDADINRCFIPEWYGDEYKGFSRKIAASVNDNKAQQFKLLATPETDVTKLIF